MYRKYEKRSFDTYAHRISKNLLLRKLLYSQNRRLTADFAQTEFSLLQMLHFLFRKMNSEALFTSNNSWEATTLDVCIVFYSGGKRVGVFHDRMLLIF